VENKEIEREERKKYKQSRERQKQRRENKCWKDRRRKNTIDKDGKLVKWNNKNGMKKEREERKKYNR
jgi:hypothetical protein